MSTTTKQADLLHKVDASLDSIRPFLEADGGNVKVLEVTKDKVVKLQLLGMCENCPMSYTTMKAGIEEAIKSAIPEIKAVEAI